MLSPYKFPNSAQEISTTDFFDKNIFQVLQRGVEKTVRREDADFAAKQPNVQSRLSLSTCEIPVKFKLDTTSKLKLELLTTKLELFKK